MSFSDNELLFDGNEKQIFATDDPERVIIRYKDVATAFGGIKRATITNKGILTNKISALMFGHLEKAGIRTHFIRTVDERSQLCHKVGLIPLEVIVRNYVAGSMAERLGLEEGMKPRNTIYELCYNSDEFGDPLINRHHAVALGLVSYGELDAMFETTQKVNAVLQDIFGRCGIRLVDLRIEFGRASDGSIILSDEISPDTCRLWDEQTLEKLDKDRFRYDDGNIIAAYMEVFNRLNNLN